MLDFPAPPSSPTSTIDTPKHQVTDDDTMSDDTARGEPPSGRSRTSQFFDQESATAAANYVDGASTPKNPHDDHTQYDDESMEEEDQRKVEGGSEQDEMDSMIEIEINQCLDRAESSP